MKAVKSRLIIDGTGNKSIENGVILVENGKISRIGTSSQVAIPSGTEIIDVGDQVILPGLIDPHRHLSPMDERPFHVKTNDTDAYKALWAARVVREDLKHGITTIRLLGQPGWWSFDFRKAVDDGVTAGPRILNAGRGVRSAAGHGYFGTPTTGVDNIRQVLRENFEKGADCVKLYITGGGSSPEIPPLDTSYYSKEEIEAAVEEAHRVGVKTAAHCEGGIGGTWFIEAGGDSIEHGSALTDAQMDLMAKKGTYFGITLWIADLKSLKEYYGNERTRDYLGKDESRSWLETDRVIQAAVRERKRKKDVHAPYAETIKKAISKKVKYTTHGDQQFATIPWNIMTLVKTCGISPMDAILANTRNGADCCGILDRVGTLEPGKYADMISVKGNPLEDITNIQRTGMVMLGGRVYDPVTGYWKSFETIEQLRCFSYY